MLQVSDVQNLKENSAYDFLPFKLAIPNITQIYLFLLNLSSYPLGDLHLFVELIY